MTVMGISKILSSIIFGGSAVCISCGRKLRRERFSMIDGSVGICSECFKTLKFTKRGSSFAADGPITYLLSPLEYNGAAENILRAFKFRSDFKNGDIINTIIKEFLESYPQLHAFDRIIPVPLSEERLNERGYNQSELIAIGISEALSVPVDTDTLIRIRNTVRQSSLPAMERAENVKGAFLAQGKLSGERIILVDDIYTTGSTMKNCAKALIEIDAAEIVGFSAATKIRKESPLLI